MDRNIGLEIHYREKGIVATKSVTENSWFTISDSLSLVTWQEDFEKRIKKAVSIFGKKSVFSVEIALYNDDGGLRGNRIALLCRELGDEENDVYTLYKYDRTVTSISKVSKARAIKELVELERTNTTRILKQIEESA